MPSATTSYGASRTSATTRTDSFRDVELQQTSESKDSSGKSLTEQANGVLSGISYALGVVASPLTGRGNRNSETLPTFNNPTK